MRNPVADAIAAVGGATKASFITKYSTAQLYNWRDAGRVYDARACVLLARESGIPVGVLAGVDEYRPDEDPREITATYREA